MSTKLAHIQIVDLVQFLSDWLIYAADNVKTAVALNEFENCLDFMSLKMQMRLHFCALLAINVLPKHDQVIS